MSEFALEILSPGQQLFSGDVSEVVLPGFSGENGILAGHEDLVGSLGTGVLKLVSGGNDYWYMVSSGVYEVRGGSVSVLADVAEAAADVDAGESQTSLENLESQVAELSSHEKEYQSTRIEYERAKARLEVHRRTKLLN